MWIIPYFEKTVLSDASTTIRINNKNKNFIALFIKIGFNYLKAAEPLQEDSLIYVPNFNLQPQKDDRLI